MDFGPICQKNPQILLKNEGKLKCNFYFSNQRFQIWGLIRVWEFRNKISISISLKLWQLGKMQSATLDVNSILIKRGVKGPHLRNAFCGSNTDV